MVPGKIEIVPLRGDHDGGAAVAATLPGRKPGKLRKLVASGQF